MIRALFKPPQGPGEPRAGPLAAPVDRPPTSGLQASLSAAFAEVDLDWSRARRGLRLRTLVILRWAALAGQLAILAAAFYGLHMPLPYLPCLATIAVAAGVNLFNSMNRSGPLLAGGSEALLQLGFDLLEMGVLLHFAGGLDNPFSLLLVAPVAVAAATLSTGAALMLSAAAVLLTVVLHFWSAPLVWPGRFYGFPESFHMANWVATVGGILFTAAYAWQASAEAARMELALQATQAVLAREQRMSALGGLAAAAAHELGTPLATIQVVARELGRAFPEGDVHAEDVQLLIEQAERCRDILRRLANSPSSDDVLHARLTPAQLLNEVLEPFQSSAVTLKAEVAAAPDAPPLEIRRLPEVLHGLSAFVENAVDFAASTVEIIAFYDATQLDIQVRDDGPGIAPEVFAKLGEPYVTTRSGGEGSRIGHVGLGLGFFIAKTLLERTGAVVEFANTRQGGAQITARWPRRAIEATGFEQQTA